MNIKFKVKFFFLCTFAWMLSFLSREQIKEVPTKLDNLLLKKHYLHGTELVVNAGKWLL